MKNCNVELETINEDRLLDQLVQDLFLNALRLELNKQNACIEHNSESLFSLDKTFIKNNAKIVSSIETVTDKLSTQAYELELIKEDTESQHQAVLESIHKSRNGSEGRHDILQRLLVENQRQNVEAQQAHAQELSDMRNMLLAQNEALKYQLAAEIQKNRRLCLWGLGFALLNVALLAGGGILWKVIV
ncbi:hypothetical protein [Leclercia sp. M50]|uniref:hypothetical protein n=1 Tax=Leclercia sp. M50 TaxID=3081258 RepID=UPI003017DAE5